MRENTLKIDNNKLESEGSNFFRYSLIVEYVGWGFFGSQRQPNVKTVQSELEDSLKKLLQYDVKVIFSGRTDKGVHAKNQVAHFNVPFELNLNRFLYSLNSILSENISVKNVQKVDKTFHSQLSAKYRWYRYTINNQPQRSVWLDKTSCHIYEKLNVESMQKALNYLRGKHDFTSFKKVNTPNPVKECVMYNAEISEKSGVINIGNGILLIGLGSAYGESGSSTAYYIAGLGMGVLGGTATTTAGVTLAAGFAAGVAAV